MLKRLTVLLLSLCTLCGAASAMQPGEGSTAKEQKALQKAQKKKPVSYTHLTLPTIA